MRNRPSIAPRIRALITALLAIAVPSPVMAAATAQATVDEIYRALPGSDFDYHKVRYAPPLKRLLERDVAAAHGEIGLIDAVPFCDCQDTAEDYAFTTSSRAIAQDKTQVTVRLHNEVWSTYRIDMVRLPSGWAVADIHGPEHASLAAWLAANLPRERARR